MHIETRRAARLPRCRLSIASSLSCRGKHYKFFIGVYTREARASCLVATMTIRALRFRTRLESEQKLRGSRGFLKKEGTSFESNVLRRGGDDYVAFGSELFTRRHRTRYCGISLLAFRH